MVDDLFEESGDAFIVRVQLHPGAGRTAVVGRHGDALKLKVAAPPEQGRANDACVSLLASLLGIDEAKVTLSAGAQSRSKRFRVEGIERDDLVHRLEIALEDAPLGGNRSAGNARGRRGVPGSSNF